MDLKVESAEGGLSGALKASACSAMRGVNNPEAVRPEAV